MGAAHQLATGLIRYPAGMASQGYTEWVKAGRPYTLIVPARLLQDVLQGHGLTVYDYPDDSHLRAATPEDHTPFSVTGWPGPNARWRARALDIMPRSDSEKHRKENADIARQLIRDRNAGVSGVMWIKYLNWTDEEGITRQERWTPNHTTRSSGDDGHVHVSGRSDVDTDTRARGYDPISRMSGLAPGGGDDMGTTWTEPLTQGVEGYAGQQRDTALAFAWKAANESNAGVQKLLAAAAADETRDAAMLAAIKALTTGEGTPDTAPIIAAIHDVARQTNAYVLQLQSDLAAARADAAAQRERLATAFGPGSE